MWEREAFLDSLEPMEFPDTPAKAAPEGHPAMTAATGPEETWASRDPPAPRASTALPGPKDPKDRKASPMPCPAWSATDTGGNPESLAWLASRAPPAGLGL